MYLLKHICSSFTKWIDFKSKATRLEFFTGLITSSLFFLLNVLIFIKFNSYANYLRDMTLPLISYFYILIAIVFAFIQCHSLLARRLNDISLSPYFSFIPFLLASLYLSVKSVYITDAYGHIIFLIILLVIVIYSILMVADSD